MHGAREIIEITAGAVHIEQQVQALELAITENNSGLAFDLAKALVESVCITILKDRGCESTKKDDLPGLLKETIKQLQLVPDTHPDGKTRTESLKRIASGLTNTIAGICELRNDEGFASHGKDAYTLQILEPVQVHLVARAADAIVNFLFKAHKNYIAQPSNRIRYQDNPEFNRYLDDAHDPILILGLSYSPSEILFNLDRNAYYDSLIDYINDMNSLETEEQEDAGKLESNSVNSEELTSATQEPTSTTESSSTVS
jgi:hypothetical protein